MLTLATGTKVFLWTEPVDLRRGHDGLCSLVKNTLTLDPFAGHLFVFIGRRGHRVKVLFWDRGRFVLYYKRLARSRFRIPRVPAGADRVVLAERNSRCRSAALTSRAPQVRLRGNLRRSVRPAA